MNRSQVTANGNTLIWQVINVFLEQAYADVVTGGMILLQGRLRKGQTLLEGRLQQRLAAGVFWLLVFLFEEIKITVVIEDQKFGFVLSRAKQVWTQPSAAANHLPELHP